MDYYAGGFGSLGSGPASTMALSFLQASIFVLRHLIPGGDPSIMNVANGFTTGLSFYYSSEHGAAAYIHAGPDATGTILATLDIPGNNEGGGGFGGVDCFFTAYCPYTAIGIAFAGTAYRSTLSRLLATSRLRTSI